MPDQKDPRPYFIVTNEFPRHPKTRALSNAAFRAVIELWGYCNEGLTDGYIPAQLIAREYPRVKKELLESGYMEKAGKGYVMHDYLDHQKSSEEIDALRAKKRAAGAKGGKVRAHNRDHVARNCLDPNCDLCINEAANRPLDDDPATMPEWAR